jgi:hypothetical protein
VEKIGGINAMKMIRLISFFALLSD